MEVRVSDWRLIRELRRRIASGDIFRAKNGKLWPSTCPACGGDVTEYEVKINFSPEELSGLGFEEWRRATREKLDDTALYLPDIPYKECGRFYFVRCDNYYSELDPCHVANYEWFRDLDAAREDFFSAAEE
jgi:hypothetical protein